jgi:beta-glucosidase
MKEFEKYADAILISFGVQPQAYLDIISGKFEPSGLLPIQFPSDMKTVEQQYEDTPRDMKCYKDADGNVYDFAFGMNWSGVINDERVEKYR